MRHFIRDHRLLAVCLLVLALCMKMVVPSGFMVGAGAKSLTIMICDGRGVELAKQISLPQAASTSEKLGEQGKAADACPYAALGMLAVSGAPAALLAVAMAFILARGVWPVARPRPALWSFLRPPLRGPPLRG